MKKKAGRDYLDLSESIFTQDGDKFRLSDSGASIYLSHEDMKRILKFVEARAALEAAVDALVQPLADAQAAVEAWKDAYLTLQKERDMWQARCGDLYVQSQKMEAEKLGYKVAWERMCDTAQDQKNRITELEAKLREKAS